MEAFMKTEFVMYSGLYTIGGVNASITYGKDRVIFEFGSAYDPKTNVFDGTVERRDKRWIRDMLRLGALPRIDGIYRREDLTEEPAEKPGIVPAEDSPYNTAIFITHLHLDHMALIGAVAPQVPIYMHRNAQIIERALEDTGEGVDTLGRDYTDLVPNEPVRVGAIEVYPLLVWEDSYCDFSFLITTPDGTLYWTGDLVLHGENSELTLRQMEFAKSRGVDVLMCDCTSFMDSVMGMMYSTTDPAAILPNKEIPPGMLSERAYYAALFENMKDIKGLCVFNYYQREMSEAARFISWAERTGRTCVFEPDAAYVIHRFLGIRPNVFVPDSRRYPAEPGSQSGWFKELLQNCRVVSLEEIRAQPGKYMLQNSYRHILELFDLPQEDGVYLHADGIPIGSFDPAYANMRRIIDRTGFKYVTFFQENFFGHGYPCQVKHFVDELDPRVLIPCHSYNPERLLPKNGRQLLPELNRTYILKDHDLKPAE
jgi:ribonuclease J